jgi:hypothetical protein
MVAALGLPLTKWAKGQSVMHKTPADKPVSVKGGVWFTAAVINTPKGGKFLHSFQVRMPADPKVEAEVQLVRVGWSGLSKEDSTGHNAVMPARKWGAEWHRWRTPIEHPIYGGGPVAFRIKLSSGTHQMRFVCKSTRLG